MSSEYTNVAPATAVRTLDGSFAFVDAPFRAGEVAASLDTEPAAIIRVE